MRCARALFLVALAAGALAACGGGGGAAARCDAGPGRGATFATADVAFAAPDGEEIPSSRGAGGGYLPWSAKLGLFVRGPGNVVVRVPAPQQDDINIVGWGGGADSPPRTDVSVASASRCWTSYPGELIFTGQPCVRLEVAGPGALRGTARFGLRRACGPETLTSREQVAIARAELVFATIALNAVDHRACVKKVDAHRCAASGEKQAAALVEVLRSHPDGIYELHEEGDVSIRELVAQWAEDLGESRPELAAKLDAAL